MIDTALLIPQLAQLIQGMPIKEAYLFGSAARNEATEDSDLDIALVCANEYPHWDFESKLAQTVAYRRQFRRVAIGIPLDVLLFSPQEWRELSLQQPTFAAEICMAGRRIA